MQTILTGVGPWSFSSTSRQQQRLVPAGQGSGGDSPLGIMGVWSRKQLLRPCVLWAMFTLALVLTFAFFSRQSLLCICSFRPYCRGPMCFIDLAASAGGESPGPWYAWTALRCCRLLTTLPSQACRLPHGPLSQAFSSLTTRASWQSAWLLPAPRPFLTRSQLTTGRVAGRVEETSDRS